MMNKKQEWMDHGNYIAQVYGVDVTNPQSVKDFEEENSSKEHSDFLRRFHEDYAFWKKLGENV